MTPREEKAPPPQWLQSVPADPLLILDPTEFLPGCWVAGESGVDQCLFGPDAAATLNRTGHLPATVTPQVDVWIDFRHDTSWNRPLWAPPPVVTVRMPFPDGDLAAARRVIPLAKDLAASLRRQG